MFGKRKKPTPDDDEQALIGPELPVNPHHPLARFRDDFEYGWQNIHVAPKTPLLKGERALHAVQAVWGSSQNLFQNVR